VLNLNAQNVKPYSTDVRNAELLDIYILANVDLKDHKSLFFIYSVLIFENSIKSYYNYDIEKIFFGRFKKMGEVVATIKLMPDSPDIDIAKIKVEVEKSIPEEAELHKIEEEPIAFGLIALNVMVVVGDIEGGTEKVEEALSKIENVGSVEVVDVRRLM